MKLYYREAMLAVHLEAGRVEVRDIPVPARPRGFALLRLLAGGICNTDLELQRGYYGFTGIPGHEFVAEVVESDTAALLGRRVVGEINLACRACDWCRKGLGRHCPQRTVLGIVNHPGAFQEFFTLPEANLHPIADALPTERAVFAEPLAAACEILDQSVIPPCSTVAVLGDGKLGLLIAMVLGDARALDSSIRAPSREASHRRRRTLFHRCAAPGSLRLGRGCHRIGGRSARRRRHDPPPRHPDPEIDRSRRRAHRHRTHHRQ
jgi:D-arabinose 1-dehydrogenase-like Zn-dependent alcohol dehydrogenase